MNLKDRMRLQQFNAEQFTRHRNEAIAALGLPIEYELDGASFAGLDRSYAMLESNQLPEMTKLFAQIAASDLAKAAFGEAVQKVVLRYGKDVRNAWDGIAIGGGTMTVTLDWEECYLPDSQMMNQITQML